MSRTKSEIGDRAAIAGIGATEFSKDSGRSELRLAVEAIGAALEDAGLRPEDVDGNGVVDFADLLAILAAWGPCP